MSSRRIVAAGLLFGLSVAGGVGLAFARSPVDQPRQITVSMKGMSEVAASDIRLDATIETVLKGARLWAGPVVDGYSTYLSMDSSGSSCVLLVAPDRGQSMTCGAKPEIATGRLTLLAQETSTSPAIFLSVLADGDSAVTSGRTSSVGNLWLSFARPGDLAFDLVSGSDKATVVVGVEKPPPVPFDS